jgi:hypothetical protein
MEDDMKPLQYYIASLILGVSLLAPTAFKAAIPKPFPGQEVHVQVRRYYDRDHHDWHDWDDHESAAYRHWLMEERREREYREYPRLRRRRQTEYWRWRHEHMDWH